MDIKISPRDKIALAKEILEKSLRAYDWVEEGPEEIAEVFYENPYVEGMIDLIDDMMEYLFTASEIDAIDWFNNTWVQDRSASILFDGVDYQFDGVSDYMNFLVAHEGFGGS